MAAQSRLALRSAGRSSQGLDDFPPSVVQRHTSPVNPRKHPLSANHDGEKVTKRPRNEHSSIPKPRNVKVYSRKLGVNRSPPPAAEEPVTQVAVSPRHPPAQSSTNIVQQPVLDPAQYNSLTGTTLGIPSLDVQNTTVANKLDKRSLRSHGGSRFKSELALYFADYDEILSDEPKSEELLTPKTLIYIVDEPSAPSASTTLPPIALEHGATFAHPVPSSHDKTMTGNPEPADELESHELRLNNAEKLDFSALEKHSRKITEDPLTDDIYFKAHRRAERGEKQHRNREKESAQHDQSQLARILEELKGQAWLKTMGITGVTDSERKSYEPKRALFIQRVTTLLDKFKAWKEEEKRRKAERERSCSIDDEDEDADEEDDSDRSESGAGLGSIDERSVTNGRAKHPKQRKATAAGHNHSLIAKGARSQHAILLPVPTEKPFTSFFSKPYQRESALSGHRRGRQRFAFGQQIPELQQRDFSLSADWLTRHVLAANARSRRAAKRDHKED
ncbi:MAG: hypothetical protein Q9169_004767 [Polycauliona sp. 2 TL-2023]